MVKQDSHVEEVVPVSEESGVAELLAEGQTILVEIPNQTVSEVNYFQLEHIAGAQWPVVRQAVGGLERVRAAVEQVELGHCFPGRLPFLEEK